MADPKQFGLAEWGVVAFFILSLITAIGVLWHQLRKEVRAAKAAAADHKAEIVALIEGHKTEVSQLAAAHRTEMQGMVERYWIASEKQVAKSEAMVEKITEVLGALSRKLDRRARGGGAT